MSCKIYCATKVCVVPYWDLWGGGRHFGQRSLVVLERLGFDTGFFFQCDNSVVDAVDVVFEVRDFVGVGSSKIFVDFFHGSIEVVTGALVVLGDVLDEFVKAVVEPGFNGVDFGMEPGFNILNVGS